MSQQHKPYTDRSSCSKTCFHVSIIECPFTLSPSQSLTFFGLFETSSWRGERDGRYFHTLYKQRVRKPRTRTSASIKNLLTCKILTMVIPNVRLFVFCVFAPFSRENSSTDFAQYFFSCVRASNSWQSPYRLPNIFVQYCIPLYILCTHVYPCNTVYHVYPYIPCVPMFTQVILYTLYTPIYLVYPCLPE